MGHGVCVVHNKSTPISSGFKATNDAEVIGSAAIKILRGYNIDPKELRGIGIQIQKLEGGAEIALEAGQGQIEFGNVSAQKLLPSDTHGLAAQRDRPLATVRPDPKPVAPVSKFGKRQSRQSHATRSAIVMDIPEPGTIDPEIWNTFMDDPERQQYCMAWKQRGLAIPDVLVDPPRNPAVRIVAKRAASRSASVEPFAKRTRLDVQSKVDSKSATVAPRADPPANRSPSRLGPTSSELGTLGINDEGLQVFRALSPESQMETMQHFQKLQKLTRKGPDVKLPSKPNRASEKEPLVIVEPVRRPAFSNTKLTDVDAVVHTIRQWTEHDIGEKPARTSVKAVQKYLLRLLDIGTGGIGGVQDAVVVLFNWNRCIQDSLNSGPEIEAPIRQAWQEAFRHVRVAADEKAIQRFGSSLHLPG